MKNPSLIHFAALILFAATGCDRQSPDVSKKIAELEQKNQAAADRQRELEQELEEQKLATERDAIERERARIEDDRAELERQQGAAAAQQDQALRERAEALSNREGRLEQFQSALEEKEGELDGKSQQLSERDRELAGREALPFEQPAQSEAVADYDMFYDSLSPYGSWIETPDYGYVWQPVVVNDSNWRPYCRGRWACSDRGWTWISEEPFGWATYHYGRWTLLRGRGWIWVPGAEWAPCWVSWRENNSHIGWAPLPPETMAYRGHNWDSSVDVQFGIGALCYNFVELRYFGSSLYSHCLPISANGGCYQQTSNITYIHIENRQVICGGPKYKEVCKGAGRDLPFYRLEIDQHPRPSRDSLAMRPRVKGDRLVVSAPNMDVAWNDGLKPKRIKDRIETVTVERDGNLGREITDRYRQTREEGRQKAEAAVVELGGADQFDQRRDEKLQDNRRLADGKGRKEVVRDLANNPERPQRDIPNTRDPDPRADQVPDRTVRQSNENRPRPQAVDDRRNPVVRDTPRVTPAEPVKPRPEPRPQPQVDDRRVARTNDSTKQVENQREPQRQADPAARARTDAVDRRQEEQARQAQQEAVKRRQDDQAQQQQLRAQREAEQAREAQKEAARQQREQRQQQELAQQREQERAQRQQQEDQQREMDRQQERAQQRQQEERQQQQEQARQRQQEENQRQQDNARQRQQEENQRQRQQDESRQKQEKDQKDQDDQRRRGR